MSPARRVGVFGGAFDPPHHAHVALARAAIAQLQLDELRVIPTGNAWHKPNTLSAGEHRAAMARLAFAELPPVVVDERELRRVGPSYTADTLAELAAEQPGAELFLLIGQDQAESLDRWRRVPEILATATICVALRPDGAPTTGRFDLKTLPPERTVLIDMPPLPYSATAVRERIAAGQGAGPMVAPAVASYIDQHHLYRNP